LFSGTSKRAAGPVRIDADLAVRPAVDESHFARLVAIERKRSEVSGAAFVIATIGRGEHTPLEFAEFVPKIADALGRAIREIDTIGWHSSGMSLGILFTEVKVRDTLADLTHAISARLSETLKEAIGPSKIFVECSAFGASGPSKETKPVSTVLAAQVIRPNERAKRAGI
jgi:hypothetical protein